ncbi:unnamed protein product [Brassica rapa subsp. narinosa]|nr:unnamed protein product [Brassica napus]
MPSMVIFSEYSPISIKTTRRCFLSSPPVYRRRRCCCCCYFYIGWIGDRDMQSTTPLDPTVFKVARIQVTKLIGASPKEIVFLSGARDNHAD